MTRLSVLAVDDDVDVLAGLKRGLRRHRPRWAVELADGGEAALAALHASRFDIVVLDLAMPGMGGIDVLCRIRNEHPSIAVVMLTGTDRVSAAVECMRLGARDYLVKPFDVPQLVAVVERETAPRFARLAAPVLIGSSPAMDDLRRQIEQAASACAPVCITGESGTGKELVSRAIHRASPRSDGPFVAINCGALSPTLVDSELFGHEKGAFTDAQDRHHGVFEQAQGGTLLLDEVAELTAIAQVKLLRVLQERRVRRLGAERDVEIDVALVCATHRDLRRRVDAGEFRVDLFYRLMVFPVEVPPLRDHPEDIAELATHFVQKYAASAPPALETDALERLREYEWPGNIRELENVVRRALVVARGPSIMVSDLPREWGPPPTRRSPTHHTGNLAEVERRAIADAVAAESGNLAAAARRLGIGRATIYRKMRKLGLRDDV